MARLRAVARFASLSSINSICPNHTGKRLSVSELQTENQRALDVLHIYCGVHQLLMLGFPHGSRTWTATTSSTRRNRRIPKAKTDGARHLVPFTWGKLRKELVIKGRFCLDQPAASVWGEEPCPACVQNQHSKSKHVLEQVQKPGNLRRLEARRGKSRTDVREAQMRKNLLDMPQRRVGGNVYPAWRHNIALGARTLDLQAVKRHQSCPRPQPQIACRWVPSCRHLGMTEGMVSRQERRCSCTACFWRWRITADAAELKIEEGGRTGGGKARNERKHVRSWCTETV
eukprot:3678420-Rhodomonas_salina.2